MIYRGVIGIDPGKHTGWAHFCCGVLRGAGVVSAEEILRSPDANRGADVDPPTIVVIELPRIYPRGGKGDPNDLIDLAVMVGDLRGFYVRHGFTVRLVTPRTWKGTVPKSIHNKRVLAALSDEERATLPKRPRARTYDHNMVDAVGLALFQLQR